MQKQSQNALGSKTSTSSNISSAHAACPQTAMNREQTAVGMETMNRPTSAAPVFMRQKASSSKQTAESEEEQEEKAEKAVESALPQLEDREIGIGGIAQVVAISNLPMLPTYVTVKYFCLVSS
jgi:hypothetical protein